MELSTKLFRRPSYRWGVVFFLMCFLFFIASVSVVTAGPEGAQVVNGQVSIQQSGSNTAITASDKAIINYSSFDIASPETVQFIQPGSTASVLNRILSANPTNINGTLLANGRVFFVNPAGVYFGNGARINVNQLVASGLNISNADFINGSYNFAGGDGAVINNGDISAQQVYLIGKQVTNSGNISCPAGYVVMAAGDRVFLGEPGSDIVLDVEGTSLSESANAAAPEVGVLNEGTIEAAGGIIALAAAGDIYSQAISNVGSLSTSVDVGDAGQIKLTAAGGEVINTGSIEASGSEGGQVAMEGARVGQFGTINADGTTGDGGNIDLWASDVVALSSDSLTTTNAGLNGNGGEVIVYSPETALFRNGARIEAKGGSESGDGGFIEVSGKNHVEILGSANASATNGEAGTFLIDPTDIEVVGAGTVTPDLVEETGDPRTFQTTNATNEILDTVIEGLLNSGTSVTLDTSNYDVLGPYGGTGGGDITVSAAIDTFDGTDNGDVTLTLYAADDITVNAAIDGTDLGDTSKLNVDLHANETFANTDDGDTTAGDIIVNAAIITDGGSFSSSGVNFASNSSGTITTAGGDVTLDHDGAVTVGANIDSSGADGGAFDISGASMSLNEQLVASNADISVVVSGGIQVDNDPDAEIITDGSVSLTANAISSTGTHELELDGATALTVVDTGAGDIDIIFSNGDIVDIDDGHVLNDIALDQVDSSSFSYRATAGDITIGTIDATGTVTVEATTGSIDDASANPDTTTDITASSIELNAATGIGATAHLELAGGTIKADTTNGAIDLDSLATAGVTVTSLTTGTGSIQFDQTGGQALDVDLATTTDGAITLTNDNALTATSVTAGGSNNIQLTTTSAGNVLLGAVNAAGDQVTVTSAAAIEDDGTDDVTAEIVATTIDLNAATGIGAGGSFDVTGTSISADTTTGTINLDSLATAGVTVTSLTTDTGSIQFDQTGGQALDVDLATTTDGAITLTNDNALTATSVTAGGSNNIQLTTTSGGNMEVGSLTAGNAISLEAAGAITQSTGTITPGGSLGMKSNGNLSMANYTVAPASLSSTDLILNSTGGSVTSDDADKWKSIRATAENNIEFEGTGDIKIGGNLTSTSGGVLIFSDNGSIYTPDPLDPAARVLDVSITGYSAPGVGVELPGPGNGVAAIAIGSAKDLTFGDSAKLNASGTYTPGTPTIDDRLAVGFDPSLNGGADPIDVAIYLRSNRLDASSNQIGNVTVGSEVTIADNGTMVIDAGEKVVFNGDFYKSIFDTSNRLEVVSRRSETLDEVITNQRLPYADNPEAIRDWFNESTGYFAGAYVLRGVKTLLAEVLALTNPVPLVPPRTLEPEFRGEIEGPDTEALAKLLSDLGIGVQPYVTEAYADSLSTDLRLYKAAEKLQELMPVLEDVNGIHIAGLRETVAEYFPTLDVLSEEQMDSFAQVLESHKGDGTDFDLAGQCIFALREYVNILGTDIGWPVETSVEFVMGRYVPRITENDEIRIAVIQMQLQK